MIATLLVTGGAGFIGSAVIRHLLAETDMQVINVDKLTYAAISDALAWLPTVRVIASSKSTSAIDAPLTACSRSIGRTR